MRLSLKKLGDNIRDIFDANTADDQKRRMAAGQPRYYSQQQQQLQSQGRVRPINTIRQNFGGATRETFTNPNSWQKGPRASVGSWKGSGLVEDLINSPFKVGMGGVQVGQGQIKQGVGNIASGLIEGPLGLMPLGKTAQAARGVRGVMPAITAGAKQGAKEGAIYGGAYGASVPMRENQDWGKVAQGAAFGTAAGGLGGALLGGGIPAAGAGARATMRAYQANPYHTQAGFAKLPVVKTPQKKVTPPKVQPDITGPSDAAYRAAQDAKTQQYKQGPVAKLKNKVIGNIYDPRHVEQKLDNQEFARLKAAGKIKPGQKELLPEQSLAVQRGAIQNPHRAAEVRNKKKYVVGNKQYSVNDIIKHYGKEESPRARDFENYRIYKDEVERIQKGESPTLGLDPQMMTKYIADYERVNPLALEHNAALRQASLEALVLKNQARIDDPAFLAKAQGLAHYNPRAAADPEDLIKPQITGGVRSGAKETKGRLQNSGGPVRSPLSLFRKTNADLEKALAEQRYGMELRRRVQEGNIQGAREVVNADDIIIRKQLIEQAKIASESAKKASIKAANTRADRRVAGVFKGGAEYQAAKKAKELLKQSVKDPDAQAAIDSLNRQDLLDVFRSVVEGGEKNVERLRSNLVKRSANHQKLVDQLDTLRAQIKQDRQNASELRAGAAAHTQHNERAVQTYSYKVDGETGKLEIPADLAESLAKQNEIFNQSLVERGLSSVSNVQKLVWTGILQPSFKVWNVLVKNPLLMYRNADGLSGIRPEAWLSVARQVLHTEKMQQFKKEMSLRHMSYENAFQTRNIRAAAADDIAARANLITFFKRNPVDSLGDLGRGLMTALASVDNAQRYAIAYGAYKRAKGLGFNEKQALDIAATAPGKVLGDFDRVTRLAHNMEVLMPYAGATQAGTRAIIRATKTKPISTTFKDASLLGGMLALTAYSMGNSEEYYQDMIDSGKRSVLDNNWNIVLPGASRDSEGKWSGVYTIPLTPDFRPANRAAWQSVHNMATGKGVDTKMIASEIFGQLTGDFGNQVYDDERSNHRKNIINGILPSSPALNFGKTVAGVNTRTGEPLADEFTAQKPRTEQYNDYTSDTAKDFSKKSGGLVTPLQLDQLMDMGGTFGDVLQARGKSADIIKESFTKPLTQGKGLSDRAKEGKAFYKDIELVSKDLTKEEDYREFQSMHSKNEEAGIMDSAERAQTLLSRPSVLAAEKKLNELSVKRGGPSNPIFGLSDEQLKKVLIYRSAKMLNNGKQTYDKNGTPLFTSLGLDEPWYDKLRDDETVFYDAIKAKKIANLQSKLKSTKDEAEKKKITDEIAKASQESDEKTFSGAARPEPSDELQAKLNYYYTLEKGTGARSRFLEANPDVLAYWEASDGFTAKERAAIGLKPLEEEDDSGYGKGYGGYGGGGRGRKGVGSLYDAAVSLNAGGAIAKPKVSVKGGSKAVAKAKIGKPKVTIKKSKV